MGWTILRIITKFLRSLTWSDLLQFIISVIIAICLVSLLSCSSVQNSGLVPQSKSAMSYNWSISDLKNMLKKDNLTDEQKEKINHAIENLEDAKKQEAKAEKKQKKQEKKLEKMQDKVVKASENAGGGKMVYAIGKFIIFIVVAVFGFIGLKKFGFIG